MKVKCREYEGYLEKMELMRTTAYGVRLYRVYLNNDNVDASIDLREVNLTEIEFIKE